MYNAERMEALKKAFAEIILNTTKEAAARVVVSERKAIGLEHDLKVAKDEALRMCLRLKHIFHLKTTEAEAISSRQEKRIDELEAQLEEAEGIIVDLREELKQVYDVLEHVKSGQPNRLKGKSSNNHSSLSKTSAKGEDNINTPEPILTHLSGSDNETVTNSDTDKPQNDMYQDCLKSNISGPTEQVDLSDVEDTYGKESDLAPILERSKEPELCKIGFTQRIWAFDRILMNGTHSASEDVDDQYSHGKNKLNVNVNSDGDGDGKFLASSKSKSMGMKKKRATEKLRKYLKVHRQRRKSRLLKRKNFTSKSLYHPSQLVKSSKRPNLISTTKIYSINGNMRSEKEKHDGPADNMDESNNRRDRNGMKGSIPYVRDCRQDDVRVIHKWKMEQNMRGRSGTFNSCASSLIMPCKNQSANADTKCRNDKSSVCESDPRVNPASIMDSGLMLIKSQCDSGATDATDSIEILDKSGVMYCAQDKEKGLSEMYRLVMRENDDAKSSADFKCELALNIVNDSEEKISSGQADKNQFLKYTRRKRKKESTSTSDISNDIDEEGNRKRRVGEKDSEAPKPSKEKLTSESYRDRRRSAQVARQLISLSGKRW